MSIAQQELDYTTLKWVKDEIQENLNQTRQALEAYVENPNDSTQIRFCATYLHQIYGTLQMVEIYGGALLAEEMEALANAISQGGVSRKEDAYDVLMRAILQLPAYLEHLENGQQDMPVILLPLLNDLRTARGEHLLSENAFFSPNLNVTPPEETKKSDKAPVDIQKYAKKLRPVYQAALVRWYRNMNPPEALQKLSIVIRELLQNSASDNAIRLWWVASGIMEGLQDKGLDASNSVKQLMGHQIDRQIKRIIDEGEQAFNEHPPIELLKNLLYYVATSTSEGTRTAQIKTAFNLEHLLPGSVDVNEAFAQLRGSKTDLMQSVSAVIKEDLLNVKDQLDIFVRTKDKPVSDLEPLIDQVHRISDTLAMLGLGDLHKIIQDQKRNISEIVRAGSQPNEMSLMEVASALLYVESSLEGLQSVSGTRSRSNEKAESLLPPSEQRQLNNLVIAEANTLIHEVKDAFNAYAMDTANRSTIEATPDKLEQIRGVLAILNLTRAANLLHAAKDYISNQLLLSDVAPNQKALDLLADVITSIEYFLEAIAENRGHPDGILRVAEASAQELGYSSETLSGLHTTAAAATPVSTRPAELPTDDLEEAIAEVADILETDSIKDSQAEAQASMEEEVADAVPLTVSAPDTMPAPATATTTAKAPAVEDDIDEEILEIFIEEADEVVGTMKENLRAWKKNNDNTEALSVLRRSYHTIKGSGRLAGAKVVGEFAWAIENMLNRILDGRLELCPEIFDLLEQSETVLETCIQHLKGELATQPNVHHLVKTADALANGSYKVQDTKPDLIDELVGDTSFPDLEDADLEITEKTAEFKVSGASFASDSHIMTQDNSLIEIFKKEADTHLAAVDAYLSKYTDDGKHKVSEPLMRALHTLHGSANMAGMVNIAKLSDPLDHYFATLYDTEQPVHSDAIDLLKQGIALVKQMVKGIDQVNFETPDFSELVAQVNQLHENAKEFEIIDDASHLSIMPDEEAELTDGLDEVIELSTEGENNISDSLDFTNDDDTIVLADNSEAGIALEDQFSLEQIALQGDGLSDAVDFVPESEQLATHDDGLTDAVAFASEQNLDEIVPIELEHTEPTSLSDYSLLTSDLTGSEQQDQDEADLLAANEDVDEELINIFLDEAEEILRNSEALIQGWSNDPNDRSIMEELQRALHTLKGGARMANQPPIANLSHRIESLLEAINDGSALSTSEVPKAVQRCQDWLVHSLDFIRKGKKLEEPQQLLDLLQSFLDGLDPVAGAAHTQQSIADHVELLQTPEAEQEIEEITLQSAEPDFIDNQFSEQVTDSGVTDTTAKMEDQLSAEEVFSEPFVDNESTPIEVPMIEIEEPTQALDTVAESSTDYDDELVDIFLEEAEEIQEKIDHILHEWVNDLKNSQLIAEIQRSLHTLKGGARMANISPIGDLSHGIESLMEAVTEGRLEPTEEFPRVIHACHDWLAGAIDRVKHRQGVTAASTLLTQLENLLAGKAADHGLAPQLKPTKTSAKPAVTTEAKKPKAEPKQDKQEKKAPAKSATTKPAASGNLISLPDFSSFDDNDASLASMEDAEAKPRMTEEQMRVKAELIDNMVNHAGEINIYNARIGQHLGQWHFNLKELEQTIGRLRDQLRNFELETEAQIMFRHADVSANAVGSGNYSSSDVSFDPLELDRFSYMQQLSRSMVESFDDLTSIQKLLESLSGDTDVLLLQQSRINTDLQEELMSTRLTPFSSVIARLRRVVRQTCQETGKQAELQVNGAEGEMDRTQLNRIVPALEHILRNAVDHGLENPNERKKLKKPDIGSIAINFSREGSEVVLRITDDGAGINVDAIRKKAVERGIIIKNSKVEDDEVLDFILQSGFSTAEKVTQISGRGVGMDVVNTEIKQLNGSLHIETERGKGTTFIIRLPLTVLINQALMVNVDEAVYAIPLSNIEHVIRITNDELNKMITGKQTELEYAGHKYQHLNIGYVLHGTAPRKVVEKSKRPLLLARSGDHRVALQVDQLIGRQEIVIKSVGLQLSSINSISGATILPNGEVALILDLSTLIRTSHALQKTDDASKKREAAPAVEQLRATKVLIVDDSITVRKVTQRLLSRHNYEAMTAKDGMDALTVMLEYIPDIILLDVEMPRMDGYELATAVRSDPRLKQIPIIMITSRTGDKHRDRALSIGVNMYMGKPFQEHELLENIQSLLHDQ